MPLILMTGQKPLTVTEQAAAHTLFDQLPPRMRERNLYVAQYLPAKWPFGSLAAWSANGSVSLKAGEWQKWPGLLIHEFFHDGYQEVIGEAGRARWDAFCKAGKGLPPLVVARVDDPDERFAEGGVQVYRKPLPKGYRAASAAAAALIRELLEQ